MQYLSQFLTGNSRIGDIIQCPERGHKFTDGAEVWGHTGVIFSAASYSRAAAKDVCMVNGLATSGMPTGAIGISLATNGTGTWVLADTSSATTLRVSTNNGQTWSNVTHSNTNQVNAVVWSSGAGRFVAFGNNGTSVTASYSTTGSSGWTAGGSVTPGATPVANTVRAATDGTTIVLSWTSSASTNTVVATSTNGSSITARTLTTNIGSNTAVLVAALPSATTAKFVIITEGRAAHVSSASDGSTWAAANTLTSALIGNIAGIAGGNGVYMVAGRSGYATSPDGSTWTYYAYPGLITSAIAQYDAFAPGKTGNGYPNWLRYEGSAFITGTANVSDFNTAQQGVFGYCTDNVSFQTRQLTYPADAVTNAQCIVASGNGYLVTAPAGATFGSSVQNSQYSSSWLTAPDYVGRARPILPAAVASSAMMATYQRLA